MATVLTIGELVEALSKYPSDAKVEFWRVGDGADLDLAEMGFGSPQFNEKIRFPKGGSVEIILSNV